MSGRISLVKSARGLVKSALGLVKSDALLIWYRVMSYDV